MNIWLNLTSALKKFQSVHRVTGFFDKCCLRVGSRGLKSSKISLGYRGFTFVVVRQMLSLAVSSTHKAEGLLEAFMYILALSDVFFKIWWDYNFVGGGVDSRIINVFFEWHNGLGSHSFFNFVHSMGLISRRRSSRTELIVGEDIRQEPIKKSYGYGFMGHVGSTGNSVIDDINRMANELFYNTHRSSGLFGVPGQRAVLKR